MHRNNSVADLYSRTNTPVQTYTAGTYAASAVSQYFTPRAQPPVTPQTNQNDIFATPLTHTAINESAVFDDNSGLDLSPLEQEIIYNPHENNNNSYILSNSNNNNANGKLDFNSLDSFYRQLASSGNVNELNSQPQQQQLQPPSLGNSNNNHNFGNSFAPRSHEILFESFDDILKPASSNHDQQQQQQPRQMENNDFQGDNSSNNNNQDMDITSLLQETGNLAQTVNGGNDIFENPFAMNDLDFGF